MPHLPSAASGNWPRRSSQGNSGPSGGMNATQPHTTRSNSGGRGPLAVGRPPGSATAVSNLRRGMTTDFRATMSPPSAPASNPQPTPPPPPAPPAAAAPTQHYHHHTAGTYVAPPLPPACGAGLHAAEAHAVGRDVPVTARPIDEVQFHMGCGVRPTGSSGACSKVAVVVGVDTYRSFPPRQDSVEDASKIKEVLSQLGYRVSLLCDAEATKANIVSALRRLSTAAAPGTPVFCLLFLSTLCFRFDTPSGGTLAACHDSSVDAGESSFINVNTVLDPAAGYMRAVVCDPSYATTLQRVAIMNIVKAVDSTVTEGDPVALPHDASPAAPAAHAAELQPDFATHDAYVPAGGGGAKRGSGSAGGGGSAPLPSVGVELSDFSHRGVKGVKVVSVRPNGAADRAGLKPGDVILAVKGRPISLRSDFRATLQGFAPGDSFDATVAPSDGSPVATLLVHLE